MSSVSDAAVIDFHFIPLCNNLISLIERFSAEVAVGTEQKPIHKPGEMMLLLVLASVLATTPDSDAVAVKSRLFDWRFL